MIPGERAVAIWCAHRVLRVQGNSKELVAGVYIALAALWGSLGGAVVMIGVVLDIISRGGVAGSGFLLSGLVPLAIAAIRIAQSRNSRKRGEA
ncbi:MAG: hypothetical protein WA580_04490 [Acidimicrobiales bacterium]